MENVIEELQNKKDLRGINKNIIKELIKEYAEREPKNYQILKQKEFNPKSKEYTEFKKFIRKKLRNLHGVFQKNKLSDKKQEKYIKEKNFSFHTDETRKFLKSHRSTNERLNYYETLYKEIEGEIGIIKKLADLGCGLNPLSYTLLENIEEAFCADINEDEIKFIQKFLDKTKIKGNAQVLDLTKKENYEEIKNKTENTDTCFLFKTLDGLEQIRKGASKELLKNIKSKNIIISFSTKTISGKNQINAERKWFQETLKEQKYENVIRKKIGEEEYYIIKK